MKKTIFLRLFIFIALAVFWPIIPVSQAIASEINPTTGQTTSKTTVDSGAIKTGLPSPSTRFTAFNGSVIDSQTGLVWLQNANCTETVGGVARMSGYLTWEDAFTWSNSLASGKCGLSDGSTPGQWRMPTRQELESLVDESKHDPALPASHPFSTVQSNYYWSSSTYASNTSSAWIVGMGNGVVYFVGNKAGYNYVWPVRGGER